MRQTGIVASACLYSWEREMESVGKESVGSGGGGWNASSGGGGKLDESGGGGDGNAKSSSGSSGGDGNAKSSSANSNGSSSGSGDPGRDGGMTTEMWRFIKEDNNRAQRFATGLRETVAGLGDDRYEMAGMK
jgi:hypothetical protein